MLREGVLREDGWHGKVSARGAILQEIIEQEVIPEEATPQRIRPRQVMPQEIAPVVRTTVSVSRSPDGRRWNAAKSQRLLSFSACNLLVAMLGRRTTKL